MDPVVKIVSLKYFLMFQDRAASVVSLCVNLSCLLAVLAEPFMPAFSASLLKQLNANKDDVNILATKGNDEGNAVFKQSLLNYLTFKFADY